MPNRSRTDPELRMSDLAEASETSRAVDPGASRYGNFINYYQFHSAKERIQQIPRAVCQAARPSRKYVALDVGCNAGNLTLELYKFLNENLPGREISILGIDLDPILIERAQEKNDHRESVTFVCLDFFSSDRESVISSYLNKHETDRFDASFCFSITMWIHLNKGDAGLVEFLREICSLSELVLIEPQPWHCYRNAARRLRRANLGDFPLLESLEYRGQVEHHIENIIREQCRFHRLDVSQENEWRRRLILYQRCQEESALESPT